MYNIAQKECDGQYKYSRSQKNWTGGTLVCIVKIKAFQVLGSASLVWRIPKPVVSLGGDAIIVPKLCLAWFMHGVH